jgi:MoxR-like ATPase
MTDRAPAEEHTQAERAGSAAEIMAALASVGYLTDEHVCTTLWLAAQLGKPVLVEGPTGTGKTELATCLAAASSMRLIRLQCYEGLDEAKALYEWNYQKQLLRILAGRLGHAGPARKPLAGGQAGGWAEAGIFTEEFLLSRPLLKAITATEPVVLLIDEADRLDVEAEALLLEVLSEYQISVPGLGTVAGRQVPTVVLTSNGSRNLTEALRRRCLYLYLAYPSPEREREIVRTKVPGVPEHLAAQIAAFVGSLRRMDLRERPSVPQTLEWARTLLALGTQDLTSGLAAESLPALLGYRSDLELAAAQLAGDLLPDI